jgi:hypothetical protein
MSEQIKPSRAALIEALSLSAEVLADVELSRTPLTNAALKASRLARLLNEFDYQKVFQYEAGGYPTTATGMPREIWRLATLANRKYEHKAGEDVKEVAFIESIEQLEEQIQAAKLGIDAARDPNISSANPSALNLGNGLERKRLHDEMKLATKRLASRRTLLHDFISKRYLELKFSNIASDAFSRIRETVDITIVKVLPAAVEKFTAIYENLQSENPEDWSNAVHGCRRVLQDLADVLFPAVDTPRIKNVGGKDRTVKLGPDNYINRLMCFAEDQSNSDRTKAIIGSQLDYLGDRLDALFQAAQKGSHATISSRDEADRYVVYTYMIVGDLLKLRST